MRLERIKKGETMKEDVGKLSNLRQKSHKTVDNVIDKAENMRQKSKMEMQDLKEKAIQARKNVDDFIKRNPERSVLIATGTGLAIGVLFTALMMKRKCHCHLEHR